MNKNVQSKKLIIAFIDLWIASLVIGLVYAITLTTLVAMKIGRLFPYINADTAFDLESNIAFLSIIIVQSIIMGGLSIAKLIIHIIITIRSNNETFKDKDTIMILLIVGFFIPIVSLVGAIMYNSRLPKMIDIIMDNQIKPKLEI